MILSIDQIPEIPVSDKLLDMYFKDAISLYKAYGEDAFKEKRGVVSPIYALKSHYIVADYFSCLEEDPVYMAGIKNESIFMSSIDRLTVGYSEKYKWNSIYELIATLFYGIIKNHPFHDANKRTAFCYQFLSYMKEG